MSIRSLINDTPAGVETVIALARELGSAFRIRAIRLDSGDLLELSREARRRLDAASLREVRIVASGGLDEWKIERLVRDGAPIDAFGVGTDMLVSTDAPALDIAYKLTSYDGLGRMKFSPGKRSLPGRKQVFRQYDDNRAVGDVLARQDEALPGRPLLESVMVGGRRVRARIPLAEIRRTARNAIAELPPGLRSLRGPEMPYPLAISARLAKFEAATARRIALTAKKGRATASKGPRPDADASPRTESIQTCPFCGGLVREEHGVFRCSQCGQVVETCCEGAPPA